MPISGTFLSFTIKYADKNLRLSPYDFTSFYWFIMSLIVQIFAVVYFVNHEGFFEWQAWIRGTIASIMNLVGCGFIILAFNSNGAPYGSIAAFA